MKNHHCVFAFALLTLSNCAWAQSSSEAQVNAILDYCVKVAPNLAPGAAAFKHILSQGNPESNASGSKAISDFRLYLGSYESMQIALSKLPKSRVVSACTSTLAPLETQGQMRSKR